MSIRPNMPHYDEAVRRFHDVLLLVSREPVRTAYEVAQRINAPLSSTYLLIAEMERLSCLSRDEAGFLLPGARTQQIGLDALGYPVAGQRLPPLVRYLREHTGETAFTASLGNRLVVGTVAGGSPSGHVLVRQSHAYELSVPPPLAPRESVIVLRALARGKSTGDGTLGAAAAIVHIAAIQLSLARNAAQPAALWIAVASADEAICRSPNVSKRLREVQRFFDTPTADST